MSVTGSIVKDDAERKSPSRAHGTDTMTLVDTIVAPAAAHRPVVDCKDDPVTALQRYYRDPTLHPRALFGQHQLTPAEFLAGLRQQHRRLQRKHVLAVQVLMQTVVVARAVFEQQWRRQPLARLMAAMQELRMRCRKSSVDSHAFIPAVRGQRERRIELIPQ